MRNHLRAYLIVLASIYSAPIKAEVVGPGSGCKTCQPGELAVVNVDDVGHGRYSYNAAPTCQVGSAGDLGKALDGIEKAVLKDFAGALRELTNTDAFRQATSPIHGEVGKVLNGGKSDTANCQLICNIVPLEGEITDYAIYAGNTKEDLTRCEAGKDCPIGWSKFESTPITTATGSSKTHCVNFMNWSHDRDRVARLVTFFKPPAKWERGRDF